MYQTIRCCIVILLCVHACTSYYIVDVRQDQPVLSSETLDDIVKLYTQHMINYLKKKVAPKYTEHTPYLRLDLRNGKIPKNIASLLYVEVDAKGKKVYEKWLHNLYEVAMLFKERFNVELKPKT